MRTFSLLLLLVAGCSTPDAPSTPPAADSTPATPRAATHAGTDAGGSTAAQLPGYTGRFAKDPKLTPAEVATWPTGDLQKRRNEIYARYGRAFKSDALRAHFEAQPWYSVNEGYSDEVLTENDKANAALIHSFEGTVDERHGQVGELYFMDPGTVIISNDPSMYGWDGADRNYVSRGKDRVITWSGPETLDLGSPDVTDAELWTWNGKSWDRVPIPRPKG